MKLFFIQPCYMSYYKELGEEFGSYWTPEFKDSHKIFWLIFYSHISYIKNMESPVGQGCRIHRLHFYCKTSTTNECPRFDTKQCDGEVPLILGLRGHVDYPFMALAPKSTNPESYPVISIISSPLTRSHTQSYQLYQECGKPSRLGL